MRKNQIFIQRVSCAVLLALPVLFTSCDMLESANKPGAGSDTGALDEPLPRLTSLSLGDDYQFVDSNGKSRPFNSNIFKYTVQLPPVPTEITITAAVDSKDLKIDYATGKTFTPEHGTLSVVSVSNKSGLSGVYFITFKYDSLPVARLSGIMLSHGAVNDFDEELTEYDVVLPHGDGNIGVFPAGKEAGSLFSYEPAASISLVDDGTGVLRGTIIINVACTNHDVGVYTLNFSEPAAPAVTVAVPAAEPAGGYFLEPQTVTLTVDDPEAFIFYSLDATNPEDAHTRRTYTEPVLVPLNTTLKVVAVLFVDDVPLASEMLQETYTLMGAVAMPQAVAAGGSYNEPQTVSLSSMTADAAIYYTTDGSDPVPESSLYAGPITIVENTELKAYAVKQNMVDSGIMTEAYTLIVVPPAVSPAAGTYAAPQNLTITCATEGAELYYTLNDAAPPSESLVRQGPFALPYTINAVAMNSTLRAYTVKANWNDSAVLTAEYIQMVRAALPQASIDDSVTLYNPTEVILTCDTDEAEIYYTTDGSVPNAGSTQYTTPVLVNINTTIKAIAIASGFLDSEIMTKSYRVAAAAPTADPPGGTYPASQSVALSSQTAGAAIYYTTDGSPPSVISTLYAGPIAVESTTTIKAFAIKSGMNASNSAEFTYTISP